MTYNLTVTINHPDDSEETYPYEDCKSLDDMMTIINDEYSPWTSLVIVVSRKEEN